MVKEIRLYIEGGGDTRYGKERLRAGFSKFFGALVDRGRSNNIRWVVIMCGPRDAAFKGFKQALKDHPSAFNILLVDSEGPVNKTPWAHLATRAPWPRPKNASDDSCHLMVQTVEAWLLADLVTLQQYYGKNFAVGRLPKATNVETIPKAALEPALVSATKATQKGEYHKIHHCSDLLGKVDPALVRARSAHCERLFTVLEGLLS
ncbi:DUF4276 family protein [Corallococcus sp. AB032C]|uniref:DUF4276 family protein n=1 Tax=Corallococcus TaxID=83461 RepID=UPI000EBECA6F|nr:MULTISPECIES: DUF4276 family protein [Corallococcus]NNB87154.1 DUF4276 family protein [Corallococcus exiguus]NPC50000.1 DUF4276 family protein [Corallococcus exiguus]RKH78406.1 DUF4276 family protein [Corallococcus sp. AB032C]